MHQIGIFTMIAGFLGVIAIGILGATRSIPFALSVHVILFLGVLAYSIAKSKNLSAVSGPFPCFSGEEYLDLFTILILLVDETALGVLL